MNAAVIKESATAGVIGLIIGLVATYTATLLWPTPWTLSGAFIAVGCASFFAAFGGAYGAHTRNGSTTL